MSIIGQWEYLQDRIVSAISSEIDMELTLLELKPVRQGMMQKRLTGKTRLV